MLSFNCKDGFTVSRGGETLFSLPLGARVVALGRGSASFRMSRGSFRHADRISERVELRLHKATVIHSGAEMTFCAKDGQDMLTVVAHISNGYNSDAIRLHPVVAAGAMFNRLWFSLPALPEESVFGCGETFHALDLRGQMVRIWVAEHQNAARITKKIILEKLRGKRHKKLGRALSYESYYAQPTFVSSRRYFMHVEGSAYMEFDFTDPNEHRFMLRDIADITLAFADDFPALSYILSGLLEQRAYTPKCSCGSVADAAPVLPRWANGGAILGIQGGAEVVRKKLEYMRSLDCAVCGVWCQDWEGARVTGFGYQLMWNWKYDEALYPKLSDMIRELHGQGIRFLGYINPFLALEKEMYKFASEQGYCVKDEKGADYLVKITTFPAAMVDLTNPQAYEWLKEIIKDNMLGIGMGGWMADFGEYLPTDSVTYASSHNGEHSNDVHNRWPALWARLNREAIAESGRLGDVLFFTRAGFTGSVRDTVMMWNGDQHVDFSMDDGLPSVIPATLSLAMSGQGLTHSDAGGYTTIMHMRRTAEVLMRWVEMNVFSPLLRTHEGNRPADNVQFDSNEQVAKHFAAMSRLHKALHPYIDSLSDEYARTGAPVMRPLFYHYDQPRCYCEAYEYLLGRDMLIAPVIDEGAVTRRVFLPDDEWIHLFTGERYSCGEHEVSAPLGRPPVFVRAEALQSELLKEVVESAGKINV